MVFTGQTIDIQLFHFIGVRYLAFFSCLVETCSESPIFADLCSRDDKNDFNIHIIRIDVYLQRTMQFVAVVHKEHG